jgi:hypothetical protein
MLNRYRLTELNTNLDSSSSQTFSSPACKTLLSVGNGFFCYGHIGAAG